MVLRAHALKGLALPRLCEITLAASCRLRPTLAAAPVLFAHAVVTVLKIYEIVVSAPLIAQAIGSPRAPRAALVLPQALKAASLYAMHIKRGDRTYVRNLT
jgi:hypothetical protein